MPNITLFVEPFSWHFQNDALFDASNTRLNRDNALSPYISIKNRLESQGVRVHTADRLRQAKDLTEINLYISLGIQNHYRKLIRKSGILLSAYFAFECPIVEPGLYRGLKQIQSAFKRVYSWSDSTSLQPFVGARLHLNKFFWPQSYDAPHSGIWENEDRNFLTIINGNKLPRLYQQELYTQRLRAIAFFGERDEIDLYGTGWDKPPIQLGKTWMPYTLIRLKRQAIQAWDKVRPDPLQQAARRVYRGPVKNKADVLGQYTFALCFENMILNGWITEKIFDCFFSGTIPVYWGAPDIQDVIPPDAFIDMRRFPSFDDLSTYMHGLSPGEIRKYRECGREFLRSNLFYPFSQEGFFEHFRLILREDAGVDVD